MLSEKMRKMNGPRRPSAWGNYCDLQAICRRCGCIMSNIEDCVSVGEFLHGYPVARNGRKPRKRCPNDGKYFCLEDTAEVAEFVRKRIRRAAKRAGTSV